MMFRKDAQLRGFEQTHEFKVGGILAPPKHDHAVVVALNNHDHAVYVAVRAGFDVVGKPPSQSANVVEIADWQLCDVIDRKARAGPLTLLLRSFAIRRASTQCREGG
jgi:hypothetical protein